MVKYTLDDLTADVDENPKRKDELFMCHVRGNRYGTRATIVAITPERRRNYKQKLVLATARTQFETEIKNPSVNETLMRTYLPAYSRERNQRNFRNSAKRAVAIGIGGLAALILSNIVDTQTSKVILEGAGVAGVVGSPIALGVSYLKYRT